MPLLQNKQLNNVFERILTDKSGSLVRVRFIVVEVNGSFQCQVVSVIPLGSTVENIQSLPAPVIKKVFSFTYFPSLSSIVSPFTELFFFTSQPTRAPSDK